MIAAALLALQLAGATPAGATPAGATPAAADSTYASEALRRLVARAAVENRRVPPALAAYDARVESEIALLTRRADGAEVFAQVEQMLSEVAWTRTGTYEQRVVGYRSQALGLSVSVLAFFRTAWTVPSLYGNRLSLFFGRDTTRARRGASRQRRPALAIHPLADDRDRVYRFTGGDTVTTLIVNGRRVPVVRVDVEPVVAPSDTTLALFRGELDLDATRGAVVRMRGQFLTTRRRRMRERIIPLLQLQALAFVELENAEHEGQFWLPSYQRIEFQAALPRLGDTRSAMRMVSRFRDLRVTRAGDTLVAALDTLRPQLHRLRVAPNDSITDAAGWRTQIGDATAAVHADDFDDVGPEQWRPEGRPMLQLRATRLADFLHYNRVEGLYTGAAAELKARDALPGFVARAALGWAWHEGTARGRLEARRDMAEWAAWGRVARTLDHTSDFRHPLDSGSTLGALIWSVDPYDYVDRASATAALVRPFGGRLGAMRVELGVGRDRAPEVNVRRGLFPTDSGFRDNRGVDEGTYGRVAAVLELNPDVNAEFLRPGAGLLVQYERGGGELDWERIEARAVARRTWRAFTFAGRVDGGMLISWRPPPQQLFELGGWNGLPGYRYKAFAGDRAAIARGLVMADLPLLDSPLRLPRGYVFPSPSPAFAASVQSGWVRQSGGAARESALRLGTRPSPADPSVTIPVSGPTNGVRATVEVGLRFFGGAVGIGWARPVDQRAPWRFTWSLAQTL